MISARCSRYCLLIAGLVLSTTAYGQAPPPMAEAQELTRGPIHEAFGQPTTFDPEAGPVVPKAPPEPIDELPPDQRPEGDNVGWISGYWAYDDEAKSHLWVSGFWRTLPPGRNWVSGYWTEAEGGHQWVSGFWASEKIEEVEYLPPPPESLENGPSTEAVEGQMWMPGCWIWRDTRYWWRPGTWVVGNENWVWSPAHYEWTPSGYIFIDGYWDYPLARRGLLFAPVTFAAYRPGLVYRPAVVLDTQFLTVSLFARPRYQHYYFGDYYAANYVQGGIYPWYAFHNSRYGYDPLYAHTSFVYGGRDPRWSVNLRATYIERRDTIAARPPRTFSAYAEWSRRGAGEGVPRNSFARPLAEVSTARDFSVKTVNVEQTRITNIKNQINQTNVFRNQRIKIEKDRTVRKEPARVKLAGVPKLGTSTAKTPELVNSPDISPKLAPAPKGKGRNLPDPEDIIRNDRPKGKMSDPVPPGKGKDVDPKMKKGNEKDDDPPAKKGPPQKKGNDKDDDPPAKKGPPQKGSNDKDDDPPAKKGPPQKKGNDKDDDPPAKKGPPQKGSNDKDDDPPAKKGPPRKGGNDKDDDPPAKKGPLVPKKKDKDKD